MHDIDVELNALVLAAVAASASAVELLAGRLAEVVARVPAAHDEPITASGVAARLAAYESAMTDVENAARELAEVQASLGQLVSRLDMGGAF
jgi:hypothetical protein